MWIFRTGGCPEYAALRGGRQTETADVKETGRRARAEHDLRGQFADGWGQLAAVAGAAAHHRYPRIVGRHVSHEVPVGRGFALAYSRLEQRGAGDVLNRERKVFPGAGDPAGIRDDGEVKRFNWKVPLGEMGQAVPYDGIVDAGLVAPCCQGQGQSSSTSTLRMTG